jgi:hypothetical protein
MKARARRLATSVALAMGSMLPGLNAAAQGCEPIRFTTPVNLGGEGQSYQPGGEWQLTVAYRRLVSRDWYVGTRENSTLAPGGSSPVFSIHTIVADAAYAISDRVRVRLSVPFSTGSLARTWPDRVHHEQRATGVGDISLMSETWLLSPRANERGNVSVGIGLKAPTGSHTIASQFFTAGGAVDFPADQTIQPGDGGWALLVQSQAFRQLTEGMFAYAFGSYMVSPKARSDVEWVPGSGQYWAVPDVYSARLGAAATVFPDQGITMSLGARVDGIPVHDLVGGGDDTTIKRTAYVIFADPGVSWSRGRSTLTVSSPYRLKVNRQKSVFEQRTNALNAGGFAKYLVFASYTHRM